VICHWWAALSKPDKNFREKELNDFVTATIVDPAGNRVHSDDELPFAQNTIPAAAAGVEVQTGKSPSTDGIPSCTRR